MAKSAYTVGGNLRPGDPFYIHRQADEDLLNLCRAGEFAYILSSRQVGKSSLMESTARQLNDEGIRTAKVDLNRLGVKTTAEKWYSGLLFEIQKELGLRTEVFAWWEANARLSFAQRFIKFFEEVLLVEVEAPVVIFIDEIDTTLSLDFTDDFFAAIRNIYNSRGDVPALRRLAFVLIGVATPSDLIKDASRTPFNIGRRVDITDFTYDEAVPLADGLGLPISKAREVLKWGIKWTGGHPYLTQRICSVIAEQERRDWSEANVDEAVAKTFFGRMSDEEHLKFVQKRMTRPGPGLERILRTYRDILAGKSVPDEEQSVVKSELKLTGIVRRQNGNLAVRNPIYARVFDRKWIDAHWPVKYWTPTVQRAALATIIALFLALFGLAIFAWQQETARAEQEQRARVLADSLRDKAVVSEHRAVSEKNLADSLRALAEGANAALVEQTQIAEEQANLATQREKEERAAKNLAEFRRRQIDSLSQGYIARKLATQAPLLQQERDDTLGVLLARQAYLFNQRSPILFLNEIYHALRKALNAPAFSTKSDPGGGPKVLSGPKDWAMSVVSPDARLIAAGSADSSIWLWNLQQREAKPIPLRGHRALVRALAFNAKTQTLASGSADGAAKLWNLKNPNEKARLVDQRRGGEIWCVGFSPDGNLLATGGSDSSIHLLEVINKETPVKQTLRAHRGTVRCLMFSPDGRSLASGGTDSTLLLWNLSELSRGPVRRWKTQTVVRCLVFSGDGSMLATGGGDGSVRLWDLRHSSTRPARILRGHEDWINAVVFSPDGKTLATGSADKTVRLWYLERNIDPLIFTDHEKWVWSVDFSPDGNTVISSSSDRTVRQWVARPEILAERVCQKVRRNLSLAEWNEYVGRTVRYERTCRNLPPGRGAPMEASSVASKNK